MTDNNPQQPSQLSEDTFRKSVIYNELREERDSASSKKEQMEQQIDELNNKGSIEGIEKVSKRLQLLGKIIGSVAINPQAKKGLQFIGAAAGITMTAISEGVSSMVQRQAREKNLNFAEKKIKSSEETMTQRQAEINALGLK